MTPIEELGLSVRVYNALKRRKVDTIEQIISMIGDGSIWKLRGIGDVAYQEITKKICWRALNGKEVRG